MRARSIVYVCSNERAAGKTALIAGMGLRLKRAGVRAGYWKPFGQGSDVATVSRAWDVSIDNVPEPLAPDSPPGDCQPLLAESLRRVVSACEVLFIEGSGQPCEQPDSATLELLRSPSGESRPDVGARVLYVARYQGAKTAQDVIAAGEALGHLFAGAIINAVPPEHDWLIAQRALPALATRDIPVIGVLPQDAALATITIGDLARRLGARILVRGGEDALEATFEGIMFGSMSAEDGHRYFSRRENKLVVTRGDRPDVHMAALGTSTRCLLLAGGYPSYPFVIDRAETLGIPVISVETDVSSTIERLDDLLATPSEHSGSKIERFDALLDANVGWQRLAGALALPQVLS